MSIEALKSYSQPMRDLIIYHVKSSQEFVTEMINGDPGEYDDWSLGKIRSCVADTAVEFIAADIDVYEGDTSFVPKQMQDAIRAYINDNFKL